MSRALAAVFSLSLSCAKGPTATTTPVGTETTRAKPASTATTQGGAGSDSRSAAPLAPPPEPAARSQSMPSDAPVLLEWSATGPAVLRNRSTEAFWVLHDQFLQPSALELRTSDGKLLSATDSRANKKFDNTVHRESFQRLEPGAELPLFELRVVPRGELFELKFGPFRFFSVPRGQYQARVVWESTRDRYLDPATGKLQALPGVWLGKVSSNPIELTLPN